jgi:hypothetical protein
VEQTPEREGAAKGLLIGKGLRREERLSLLVCNPKTGDFQMKHAMVAIVMFVVGSYPVAVFAECTDSEIHQQTVACYNQCISHGDMAQQQQCAQGCVDQQNAERKRCNLTCTDMHGYKVFCQ